MPTLLYECETRSINFRETNKNCDVLQVGIQDSGSLRWIIVIRQFKKLHGEEFGD
jgi:hypothetical protein